MSKARGRKRGPTTVIVTHDDRLLSLANRIDAFGDFRILEEVQHEART